ncbi:YdeI/OmpD-associated family protein [Paenibacillus sp. CR_12]|uniref:YdeI/OmpD-associated family protein n=1 Tax=Paenibacillus sp. CR_12 TaxID=3055793 RepID=UPI0035BFA657
MAAGRHNRDDGIGLSEQNPAARQFFDRLPYSDQRRLALSIEGAKTMETRQRRIDKSVTLLNGGRAQKDGEFLPVKSKNPVLPWQYRVLFMAGYFNGTCLDNASNRCRCGAILA